MQYHYHYHKALPLTSLGIVRDIKCYHTSLTGIPILCNVEIALNGKAYALKTLLLTSASCRLVINVLSLCPDQIRNHKEGDRTNICLKGLYVKFISQEFLYL